MSTTTTAAPPKLRPSAPAAITRSRVFPFAVFVLTGFFKTLPASLHESALLDGATEFQAFWHVMLPLARPGLITVAIGSSGRYWGY